jgi:hypothetical protein
MTPDMDRPPYSLPDAAASLIDYLFIEDGRTRGQPLLRPEDEAFARQWLEEVLVDTLARLAHTEELKRRYRAAFHLPLVRREWPETGRPAAPAADPLFRHRELLPADLADAVAEKGVGADVLPTRDLARLLLNPLALWDLADLIDYRLPLWWLEPIRQRGLKLMAETGFEMLVPTPPRKKAPVARVSRPARREPVLKGDSSAPARGVNCLPLLFDESSRDLERRIAEHLYGEVRAFALVLYRQDVAEGMCELELEVSPAPTKNDLTFTVCFPSGEERELTVEVPRELKVNPAAKPRERTRSDPCEALPADKCRFDEAGQVIWVIDMPPRLRLSADEGAS